MGLIDLWKRCDIFAFMTSVPLALLPELRYQFLFPMLLDTISIESDVMLFNDAYSSATKLGYILTKDYN
jgi:hypothetical protein